MEGGNKTDSPQEKVEPVAAMGAERVDHARSRTATGYELFLPLLPSHLFVSLLPQSTGSQQRTQTSSGQPCSAAHMLYVI